MTSTEKDRPACTCNPARIDGYLIHRQDCARSGTKRPPPDERCPNDGQTLAWHRHAELGPDGRPRTNAAFIGCDWPDTCPLPPGEGRTEESA